MADKQIFQLPTAPAPLPTTSRFAVDVIDPSSPTGWSTRYITYQSLNALLNIINVALVDNSNGSFSLVDSANPSVIISTINKATLTQVNATTYTFDNGDGIPVTFTTGGGGGGGTSLQVVYVTANRTITSSDAGKILKVMVNNLTLTIDNLADPSVINEVWIDVRATGTTIVDGTISGSPAVSYLSGDNDGSGSTFAALNHSWIYLYGDTNGTNLIGNVI